ncbi:hypothetical protein [Nitrospirillum amazonense]|uniref:Uncharacterized protein n=1 Tax=Nitrospirillum amazonense TaxID=28077 RepID=A0A560JQM2_9PROT|nr:hypothetical protein [Nitrospirillum amazonense]MDG3442267.1 hypothetical protein [Nitrospirillum amazonense]TWB73237.1 hypothetical protein FBZ87_105157 [Nitrospirillum amazonense]
MRKRRSGLAVALMLGLAACASNNAQEHGTALHHLGGPADGVVLPPVEGPRQPGADGADPQVAPDVAPVPGAPSAATTGKRPAAALSRSAQPAPATAAGPFAPPPDTGIQEVVVTPLDVSGYWKITARSTFGLGDSAFYKRYENDTHICRFEQTRGRLRAYCPLLDSVGEGELEERHLSLSWSLAGGIAFHVDAEVEGTAGQQLSFTGQANGRLVGFLPVTAQVPARGVHFEPPADAAPPSLAALRQALADWDGGQLTPGLYTPNLLPRLSKLLARPNRAAGRGALQGLRYIGSIERALNKKDAPDARVSHDVYEARYASGTWLCVVHLDADGKISDFAC